MYTERFLMIEIIQRKNDYFTFCWVSRKST